MGSESTRILPKRKPEALYAVCGLPAEICAHSWTGIKEYLRLKLSTQCGCRPKAPQKHQIIVCDSPACFAIERSDQRVASVSAAVSVRSITSATFSSFGCPRASQPGLVRQALNALFEEAPAPLAHGVFMHPDLGHHGLVARGIMDDTAGICPHDT